MWNAGLQTQKKMFSIWDTGQCVCVCVLLCCVLPVLCVSVCARRRRRRVTCAGVVLGTGTSVSVAWKRFCQVKLVPVLYLSSCTGTGYRYLYFHGTLLHVINKLCMYIDFKPGFTNSWQDFFIIIFRRTFLETLFFFLLPIKCHKGTKVRLPSIPRAYDYRDTLGIDG